jgi:hypothetical protein
MDPDPGGPKTRGSGFGSEPQHWEFETLKKGRSLFISVVCSGGCAYGDDLLHDVRASAGPDALLLRQALSLSRQLEGRECTPSLDFSLRW